jgi:lysylphosphatidylglycerol synthetase-like protein (DUF2156 family)
MDAMVQVFAWSSVLSLPLLGVAWRLRHRDGIVPRTLTVVGVAIGFLAVVSVIVLAYSTAGP